MYICELWPVQAAFRPFYLTTAYIIMERSRLRTLAEKRYLQTCLFDFFKNEIKCPCKYITVPFPPTFTVHCKQLVVSFQAASYMPSSVHLKVKCGSSCCYIHSQQTPPPIPPLQRNTTAKIMNADPTNKQKYLASINYHPRQQA